MFNQNRVWQHWSLCCLDADYETDNSITVQLRNVSVLHQKSEKFQSWVMHQFKLSFFLGKASIVMCRMVLISCFILFMFSKTIISTWSLGIYLVYSCFQHSWVFLNLSKQKTLKILAFNKKWYNRKSFSSCKLWLSSTIPSFCLEKTPWICNYEYSWFLSGENCKNALIWCGWAGINSISWWIYD